MDRGPYWFGGPKQREQIHEDALMITIHAGLFARLTAGPSVDMCSISSFIGSCISPVVTAA